MSLNNVLIANRGEIAIRIARAAADLGIRSVAVHSEDDAASLHTRVADEARALEGSGVMAYLDIDRLVEVAREAGCDAVHPGYGFLAESAEFARRCAEAGLVFVGPTPEQLGLFGDKGRARAAATAAGVPTLRGLDRAVTVEEASEFLAGLDGGSMMIKAVAGGGGRGTRAVAEASEVPPTFERCASEAQAAFGNGDLYVEEFMPRARHIEVQILGDGTGAVAHLGERECSIQRRYQKIVEIAPAPEFDETVRSAILDAAVKLAASVDYANAGTFEFLLDVSGDEAGRFAFIETNARLQVEHTVTEAVTGVDIVQAQLRLAGGETLADFGLDDPALATPRGFAIQARVNMETVAADGTVRPSSGTLAVYEAPSGPGVRTDGFGYAGYTISPRYDSLLAKVIGHAPSARFADAVARTSRALSEFRIEGVTTNIPLLQNILAHEDFAAARVHTRFVDEHLEELAAADASPRSRYVEPAADEAEADARESGFAGAQVDQSDPLALFAHDAEVKSRDASTDVRNAGTAADDAPDLEGG